MTKVENYEVNPLSTNLMGFENYLKKMGLSERQIAFHKLAPRKLFRLFGTYSSIDLLKSDECRSKFLKIIEPDYKAGTLKKYSAGISHYRNYLISENIIVANMVHNFVRNKCGAVRVKYHKSKTTFFMEVESKFYNYLTVERKYSDSEIRKNIASYQRFSAYVIENGLGCFSDVVGNHILQFRALKTTCKTDWNKLPVLLRFLYREGYVSENYSGAIILNKKNRLRRKKYLSESEIEKILNSVVRSDSAGARTYTMFLLMARMGLRPSETIRIRLNDIDWVNGKLLIRGKGNRLDWLPVSVEVAEAIVHYLKISKRGSSDFLFLQERPPHNAIRNTTFLSAALKLAYQKTRISPPTENIRLNVFRHSFATRLVNSEGQNFFTAQVFLRHSSPDMTLHYAKYHAPKLRLFEMDWPELSR